MFSRARHAALIWLCLLIYAISGTLRTAGLVLCVGEGRVRFALVGDAGGCACCAVDERDPDCSMSGCGASGLAVATPKARAAADCCCIDIPLLCGRDDHQPQHPGTAAKPQLPEEPVGWLAPECSVAVPAVAPCAAAVRARAPPWSAQAQLSLRSSVLLLI